MSIAGEWCNSEDGATADVLNPASGEVIATVPKATIADVNRCVDASRAAFKASRAASAATCSVCTLASAACIAASVVALATAS